QDLHWHAELELHVVVRRARADDASDAAIEQAQLAIRRKQPKTHAPAEVAGVARSLVAAAQWAFGSQRRDLRGEFGGDPFVGVQAQHEVVPALVDRELPLRGEARERRVAHDPRAEPGGDLAGAVGAAAVDDDDLVAVAERLHAGGDAV